MRARTLLKYSAKLPLILIGPICILAAVAAGTRATLKNYQWPVVEDRGAAHALDEPSFVLASDFEGIVWKPRTSGSTLHFQPLALSSTPVGILPYPDVAARRWQAVPADLQAYHLIWVEQDGRLRSALIRTDGETLRGPIELAPAIEPYFTTVALPDHNVMVLWIHGSHSQLSTVVIDQAGRPGAISSPLSTPVSYIAAALDQTGVLHLVWLSSSAPHEWSVNILAGDPFDLASSSPQVLYTFKLANEEAVVSAAMGLDQTHSYIFWSTTHAVQPDVERIQMLTFPTGQPESKNLSGVVLPRHFKPTEKLAVADLQIGVLNALETTPRDPAALRWLTPAPGQHSILPAALAVQTAEGWRPGMVYFQNGQLLGLQIIAQEAADAGPPVLAVDAEGDLHLAWEGLTGALPHLFTADTAGQGLISAPQEETVSVLDLFAGVLAGMPWALVWLICPTCVVAVAPRNTWTPPLSFALYGGAKLLLPRDLFARLPALLASADLDRFDPGLVVYTATLGIAMLSLVGYGLTYRRPLWQRWLTYVVCDASLTWTLFGTNLSV